MNTQTAWTAEAEKALYGRVTRRIIPFLFLCYVFAYVDRVNVGFAKLQMQQDLRISDAVYGMGAGMFFLGYFFFEVPCNMALQKIGAKYWLGPIMVVWGVVSACQMLVTSAAGLYFTRFLLGVVESGFFPGVILYLTFWYPRQYRAKMLAAFMTAIPLSGVIGGPVSGWILESMSGHSMLRGWQWLFVFEAIPSVIAGVLTIYILDDGPRKARWLNDDEKHLLEQRLEDEARAKRLEAPGHHTLADAFRSPKVWALSLMYFGMVMVNYGISFWLPQIVKETLSRNSLTIGFLTAIPWALAAVTMVAVGHHSDKTGERRWHIALTSIICSAAFAASAIPGTSGVLSFVALTIATASIAASYSTFWALPTTLLSGTAASAGIAWINSVGNLAGYVSPYLVGKIRDTTHSMTAALLMLSFCCLVSGILTLVVFRPSAAHANGKV
ncbi:MAG: MFS transporter [Bryobacteraceae bacterium]